MASVIHLAHLLVKSLCPGTMSGSPASFRAQTTQLSWLLTEHGGEEPVGRGRLATLTVCLPFWCGGFQVSEMGCQGYSVLCVTSLGFSCVSQGLSGLWRQRHPKLLESALRSVCSDVLGFWGSGDRFSSFLCPQSPVDGPSQCPVCGPWLSAFPLFLAKALFSCSLTNGR